MLRTPPARTPGTYASSDWVVPRSVWSLLPARWIRALAAFPIAVERGARRTTIVVAMAHPGDLAAVDDIAFATGMDVRVVAASREAIDRAVATHLGPEEPPGPDGEAPSRAPEPGNALPRAQSWFVSPRGL